MTWHVVTWRDTVKWRDVAWPDMTRHHATWRDLTWHDVTWRDMTWHDVTRRDMAWNEVKWHEKYRHLHRSNPEMSKTWNDGINICTCIDQTRIMSKTWNDGMNICTCIDQTRKCPKYRFSHPIGQMDLSCPWTIQNEILHKCRETIPLVQVCFRFEISFVV